MRFRWTNGRTRSYIKNYIKNSHRTLYLARTNGFRTRKRFIFVISVTYNVTFDEPKR